jgi:hypothetical protein
MRRSKSHGGGQKKCEVVSESIKNHDVRMPLLLTEKRNHDFSVMRRLPVFEEKNSLPRPQLHS